MQPKCCELDVLQPTLLKKLLPYIIKPMTYLINASFSNGVFASNWKTAIIKPLLKKPGLELITKNYRPVSNLSFLSKLLEKCALVRFNNHCKENDLMQSYQSAYREHHSCKTAPVRLTNDFLWNMEVQQITALVAIDGLQHSRSYSIIEGLATTFWSKWQGAKLDGYISKAQGF